MRNESNPNNLRKRKRKKSVLLNATIYITHFHTISNKIENKTFGRWDNNRCKPENKIKHSIQPMKPVKLARRNAMQYTSQLQPAQISQCVCVCVYSFKSIELCVLAWVYFSSPFNFRWFFSLAFFGTLAL